MNTETLYSLKTLLDTLRYDTLSAKVPSYGGLNSDPTPVNFTLRRGSVVLTQQPISLQLPIMNYKMVTAENNFMQNLRQSNESSISCSAIKNLSIGTDLSSRKRLCESGVATSLDNLHQMKRKVIKCNSTRTKLAFDYSKVDSPVEMS